MKQTFIKPAFLSVLMIMVGLNGYAEEPADSVKLNEVVITATRTLRNLNEVPARISVVGSSMIDATPALQIDDILRYTPGVNVNRGSGIYSMRPSVTLRGLSGNEQSRTLVLLNGVPINTSDEGGVNWNRINQADVERIEVSKGPGSSLYGNNAMGGVINIITKNPDKPQEVAASVSYGSFNTFREDLNLRIRTDKGYYGSVSQYYLKSDGYNSVPKEDRTPYDIKRSLEAIGVSAKAGNDYTDWFKWELQYDIYHDTRGEGYQIYTPDGCYRNFNTNLLRGLLKGGNSQTWYDLNLYYQHEHYYDVNEQFRGENYSRYDVDSNRKDYGAIFNISHTLGEKNTLTGGLEYKRGSVKGGDYYQTAPYDTVYNAGVIQTFAGYLQDEHAFFDNKIRVIAGVRFDRVSFSDGEFYSTNPWEVTPELKDNHWSEFSPRLGMRFNFIEQLSGYLSYSHGFRASILDDLTRTGYMWVGPKVANPDLGPESINNYEIGFDYYPVDRLKISASGYYAKGKDFLYYVTTGDQLFGRPVYRRENVTNVTIGGLETEASYTLSSNFRVMASYTYTHSKIDEFEERPELENKYLTYTPKHNVSASLFWKNKYVDVSIRGLYKSKQFSDDLNEDTLDDYTTFDVQLSRQLSKYFYVALDVQDLFNNRHMETANDMSPGRTFTGKVALRF